jgi:hypothetical protein
VEREQGKKRRQKQRRAAEESKQRKCKARREAERGWASRRGRKMMVSSTAFLFSYGFG